jgi:hypothetical protein
MFIKNMVAGAILIGGLLFMVAPAEAITAGEVLDKMDAKQASAYVSGAVDMASVLYWDAGQHDKANCALKWYFDTKGSIAEVMGLFENYKDKDAVALLQILIDRHCK